MLILLYYLIVILEIVFYLIVSKWRCWFGRKEFVVLFNVGYVFREGWGWEVVLVGFVGWGDCGLY